MRPRFRDTLRTYSEKIKEGEAKKNASPRVQEGFRASRDFALEEAANDSDTNEETQGKIYAVQESKQRLMCQMRQELAALHDPNVREIQRHGTPVYARDGRYFFQRKEKEVEITLGEIMTDGEWGREYTLDAATVPYRVRKEYIIERTRRNLSRALDKQIILEEEHRSTLDEKKRDTYAIIREKAERGDNRAGIVAERMVKNFLKKLSFDFGVDFTVEDADVYQDVELKVDFAIKRKRHVRGVGVEAREDAETIGVQFTMNTDVGVLERKTYQVDRVREELTEEDEVTDIILVTIPLDKIMSLFHAWEHDGAPAGGPDKLWPMSVKQDIFYRILDGIFTPDEIDEQWKKIARQTVGVLAT